MAYSSTLLTNWFVPGDGIERQVIGSMIQRYLGNDATVRPGLGKDEFQGVSGYWINAYRNLTSRQVEDIKEASRRYRNDVRKQQPPSNPPDARMTGDYGRGYPQPGYGQTPNTYTNPALPPLGRNGGDSPNDMDHGYPGAPPRDRYGALPHQHRMDDMDVDMAGGYGQPARHRYDDDPRGRFGDARLYEDRPQYHDTRPPYGADPYGYRPSPGTGGYGPDPRTNQAIDYRPDSHRGPQYGGLPPSGNYGRQPEPSFGNYPPMPPATAPPATHMQQPYGTNSGYQPPPGPLPGRMNQGLDVRDPRYTSAPPKDYAADRDMPRYDYPSPPVTVVGARDGMPSAPSPSGYPGAGQPTPSTNMYGYDGRAAPPTTSGSASYQPITTPSYNSGTSPSTMPKSGPLPGPLRNRTGEGSEDGEPPRTRTRYI